MVDAMIRRQHRFVVQLSHSGQSEEAGRDAGELRSGRMIYEFITMTDDALATVAYRFTHIVKADIKNFYPSVYTSLQPCLRIHGKRTNPIWQGQESP